MDITRFGHAALLVEVAGTRVLLDPGAFCADEVFALSGLDAVVVTHQHPDHLDPARIGDLVELNPTATLLAEPETAQRLADGALADVPGAWTAISPGDDVTVGAVRLRGVGGRHAVIHPEMPRIGNTGVLLSAEGSPVLFHPGDAYDTAPDDVDVLAVPLSAPWAKVSETVDFVRAVAPRIVLPIHDATISDLAYDIYWGRVAELGGADARRLGPRETLSV